MQNLSLNLKNTFVKSKLNVIRFERQTTVPDSTLKKRLPKNVFFSFQQKKFQKRYELGHSI